MTYLEAAYQILKQAGEPLHYKEITERALAQGLIQPTGLTPEATMGSRLYTDTKQEGSRFVRAGKGVFDLAERQPSGIDRRIQEINRTTRDQLSDLLHTMPPDRFEALIGELLIQMGFDESAVQVTQRSKDGGIDVVGVFRAAGLTEMNVAVQVKRWKGNVGAPVVTQLRGSLQVHQQGIIITTSDFSKAARKEASAPNKTRIGLISGEELIDLLIKHQVGVVEKTLKVIGLDDEWWGEMLGVEDTEPPEPKPEPVPAVLHKPTSIALFERSYPIHTWKEVLLKTIEALQERHPDDFVDKATTLHGRKRQYIALTRKGMIAPHAIPNTNLWVETNLSAKSIQKLSQKLLALFGYRPEELSIQFAD